MSASEWIEDIDGILRWTSALGREHLFARGESGRSMPLTAERQVTVTLPPESDMACTTAQADQHPVSYRSVRPFRSNTCRRTVEEAKGRSGSNPDHRSEVRNIACRCNFVIEQAQESAAMVDLTSRSECCLLYSTKQQEQDEPATNEFLRAPSVPQQSRSQRVIVMTD